MKSNELRDTIVAIADSKNEAYQQGRADVITEIAKIIDDYSCDRDVKTNVNLMERISQYIYEQTKEQKNE